MEKCIFLDKDGTIIYDEPYNVDPSKIRCYPDTFDALRTLAQTGYKLVIISNQSGLAKGLFNEKELQEAFTYTISLFEEQGVPITDYYFCPHTDADSLSGEGHCSCRKPLPGLLLQASKDHHIDLRQSWMIGDILADIGAGHAAGCRTILIDRSGTERKLPLASYPCYRPDYITDHFSTVVSPILNLKTHDYEHIYQHHHATI